MASRMNSTTQRRRVAQLLRRDGNRCFWCSIEFVGYQYPTVEHIITAGSGGTNEQRNLVLACSWCNNTRGDMNFEEFAVLFYSLPRPKEWQRIAKLDKHKLKQLGYRIVGQKGAKNARVEKIDEDKNND